MGESSALARASGAARSLVRGAVDIVLPPLALDPGARGPVQGQGLSAQAWRDLTFLEAPVCDGCGAPLDYDVGAAARCPACLARPRAFDRARAAVVYDEHSRDLVLKLKHADRTDLARLFATWLARAGRDLFEDADALVAVPLHRWRLIARRYNQAAEIARPLARLTSLAWLPDALVRRRPTPIQGGRSATGRRRNVAGAFAVPRRAWSAVEGKRLVLVDDVLTTGATAEACARVLKAAGALRVDVAAVARVKEIESRPI
ncbi:MAG TPA: ComF family protein [Caulobacteraceae bacterium]|nr:ComF family protein [Caulobacteraceae bacterium]